MSGREKRLRILLFFWMKTVGKNLTVSSLTGQTSPKAVQLFNVFRSRWCGAYWQSQGITVIPNVSWGDVSTFDYCFDGIEEGSTVAVGTIGCKRSKIAFMRGYNEMLKRIKPSAVICFGSPFTEMQENLIPVDYNSSRRVNRNGNFCYG